jgi:hypothetical protein
MPDGRYLDESTIYLRSTEPGASLVVALDWHDNVPTQLVVTIGSVDTDQQTIQPGQQLVVSRALPELPLDTVVGVRLSLPHVTGAQPGDVLPLVVHRVYFTRGAAEAAIYRTIASRIEQTPPASQQLFATADELLLRQALLDAQAALLDTQAALRHTQDVQLAEVRAHTETRRQRDESNAALAAAQAEIARLENELAQRKQSPGQTP